MNVRHRPTVRPAFAAFALAAALLFPGCATEPDDGHVAVDQIVDYTAHGDTSRTFTFAPSGSVSEYALMVETLSGGGAIGVADENTGTLLGGTLLGTGGASLADNLATRFTVQTGHTYTIASGILPGGTSLHARFQIRAVHTGPEVASGALAVGDTVSGETLEPWTDADVFSLNALPGQQVYVGGTTVAGGSVRIWAAGSSTAASTTPSEIGPLTIPSIGLLTIRVDADAFAALPRFHGAYRLWVRAAP